MSRRGSWKSRPGSVLATPSAVALGHTLSIATAGLLHMNKVVTLTEPQRKYLRGLAHGRSVIVQIGQAGWSQGVSHELEGALLAHELVKVRARLADRETRDHLFVRLADETSSALVQRIGHVAVFYRPHPERQRILLPAG
jgi:RNA-binding protein